MGVPASVARVVTDDTLGSLRGYYGKSDRFDAFVLYELARTNHHPFRVLEPDCDETNALRALTRGREDLVGMRTARVTGTTAHAPPAWSNPSPRSGSATPGRAEAGPAPHARSRTRVRSGDSLAARSFKLSWGAPCMHRPTRWANASSTSLPRSPDLRLTCCACASDGGRPGERQAQRASSPSSRPASTPTSLELTTVPSVRSPNSLSCCTSAASPSTARSTEHALGWRRVGLVTPSSATATGTHAGRPWAP